MDSFTLDLRRCWVLRALGRNTLVRTGDRVEALVVLLVLIVALAALPIAGAIGTAAHEARARAYVDESLTRHTVAATVIEDGTLRMPRWSRNYDVRVRWNAGGVEHVDTIVTAGKAKAGERLDIWVDDRGNRVAPPTPTWQAGVDAVLVGVGTWFVVTAGAAGVSLIVRYGLIRHRYRAWDREWEALVSDDGGRTGRQP